MAENAWHLLLTFIQVDDDIASSMKRILASHETEGCGGRRCARLAGLPHALPGDGAKGGEGCLPEFWKSSDFTTILGA